jgi:ribosomal protein S18 acetylase RimI-like enzyme
METLELAGYAAWPALHEEIWADFRLRVSGGASKRLNSISIWRDLPDFDPDQLQPLKQWFADNGRPLMVRLVGDPPLVSQRLDAAGWPSVGETVVMVRSLSDWSQSPDPTAISLAPEELAACHAAFVGDDATAAAVQTVVLQRIAPPSMRLALLADGAAAAVGLAVLDRRLLGLLNIAVDPAHRRQGLGRRWVETALAFGEENGAAWAWLQVEAANAPALALYKAFGFKEAYRYVYRQEP